MKPKLHVLTCIQALHERMARCESMRVMPTATPDTNRRTIVARLEREGWVSKGGGNHDIFEHPTRGSLAMPRHRDVSLGVARSIAKRAGW